MPPSSETTSGTIGFTGSMRDLQLRVMTGCGWRSRAEEERNLLITAVEQSADTILITDADGTIQYTNPAFTSLTGFSAEEAHGQNPRILKSGFHPPEFYTDMWSQLKSGQVWQGRVVNCKKNGDHFTEEASISPVLDQTGKITHFVGVKRDITREVVLEDRLRHSRQMESLGMLAGGLAHDFNNILYAVTGNVQLALDDLPEGHPARLSLQEIQKASGRASDLVAKMLALGRPESREYLPHSLTAILDETLSLIRGSVPQGVSICKKFAEDLPQVLVDTTQIHQVILNICANAFHAMGQEGGVLEVELQEYESAIPDPVSTPGLAAGHYLKMTFRDNGSGMSDEVCGHIFDPYFTTKSNDEGTGLGLATVQGIIRSHQGQIYVQSRSGVGSTFTIFLPVCPEKMIPDRAGNGTNAHRDSADKAASTIVQPHTV